MNFIVPETLQMTKRDPLPPKQLPQVKESYFPNAIDRHNNEENWEELHLKFGGKNHEY